MARHRCKKFSVARAVAAACVAAAATSTHTLHADLARLAARRAVDHRAAALAQPSLKYAHAYCKTNSVSSQSFGPTIETYIIREREWMRQPPRLRAGDAVDAAGLTYEIKASLGGAAHGAFNYVQIRPAHDIDVYLLTAFHLTEANACDGGELYVFRVAAPTMYELVARFGKYAHGTRAAHGDITAATVAAAGNDKEYALRPRFGDACWAALKPYREI
jgi:hypothetical protein